MFQKKSSKAIKEHLAGLTLDEQMVCVPDLLADERKAVKKLGESIEKKFNKHMAEIDRINGMIDFDRTYGEVLVGVDEVGRGPLAGPVVTCSIIMDLSEPILGVKDSKLLKEEVRERLYDEILEKALDVQVKLSDEKVIDEINILNATKKAMTEGVLALEKEFDTVLLDAVHLDDINSEQVSIIKGDMKSYSIACASIIAKVHRDRMMVEYHGKYPHYAFDKNKGYGTKAHYEGIDKHGICEIHRRSFLKNVL